MIAGVFPATTMPDEAWWRVLWPDPVSILGEMRVRLGMVVIDLCCGDGLFTIGIAGIARRVYAVDIDPATLDRARRRVKAAGATNCDFIAADAMAGADILPEPVDYVFPCRHFTWSARSAETDARSRGNSVWDCQLAQPHPRGSRECGECRLHSFRILMSQRWLERCRAALIAVITFGVAIVAPRAFAEEEGCQLDLAPKNIEATRGGDADLVTMSARPPSQASILNAELTLEAPGGVTAIVVGPPPTLPTLGDIAWKVRIKAKDTAPAKGEIIIDLVCRITKASGFKAPLIRHSIASLPFTVRSATQAFEKLKMRVDGPVEPVNEWRAGVLSLTIENQSTQDFLGASVVVTAPTFMKINPAEVPLDRIGAGTTRTLSFRVSQVGRAEPGAASPSFLLKAHAAGETTEGMVTIAAPVDLSVLGLSDALKLVQVPSFLFLPGALFLLTCELIWQIRNQSGDFPLSWSKPSFWVGAISLSIVAAFLYPRATSWFGSPREYLTAYTFLDVMLVWFASIILAVPTYGITAIVRHKWVTARAAAEERARRQRELSESDEPLVLLQKLVEKGAVPRGQMFPTVTIESGGNQQTVLHSGVKIDKSCWIVPLAGIRSTEIAQDIDWKKIDQVSTAASSNTPSRWRRMKAPVRPSSTTAATTKSRSIRSSG